MRPTLKFFSILGFFIFFVPSVVAKEIVLDDEKDSIPLGKYIRFLEDKNKDISLKDVISGKLNKSFVQGKEDVIFLSYQDTNYWLEFPTIQNFSDKKEWFIFIDNYFSVSLKTISFYFVIQNQVAHKIEIPSVKEYQLQKKFPLISIPIPPELLENKDLKIFVHSNVYGLVSFPFSITNTKISNIAYKKVLVLSIFIGAMALLFIYNLFIFLSFRDKAYFFYIAYLFFGILAAAITLYKLETLLGLYIETEWRILGYIFVMLFLIGYSYYFLEIKKNFPSSKYLLGFLVILLIITSVIIPIKALLAHRIIAILGILNFLLILFVGIVCYIRGCRQARFFLVGWSLFVLTTCCWLLYVLGVIPYSIIVAHIQLLGSFVEATFLSLALADRFYLLKIETDKIYERLKKANS